MKIGNRPLHLNVRHDLLGRSRAIAAQTKSGRIARSSLICNWRNESWHSWKANFRTRKSGEERQRFRLPFRFPSFINPFLCCRYWKHRKQMREICCFSWTVLPWPCVTPFFRFLFRLKELRRVGDDARNWTEKRKRIFNVT